MSDKKEQTTEEIINEMQDLMKRQVELQNKLLQSNWGGFNDALGAFMDIFKGVAGAQTDTENKPPEEAEEDEET